MPDSKAADDEVDNAADANKASTMRATMPAGQWVTTPL